MEKLVLHTTSGHNEYDCYLVVEPFLYESKIAAQLKLLELWESYKLARKNGDGRYMNSDVIFAGVDIDLNWFGKEKFQADIIMTLDEWFDRNASYDIKN